MPVCPPAASSPRPQHVAATSLNTLADRFGVPRARPDVVVRGVTASSTDVRPGDLFAALPGATTHGIAHLDDAVGRGAVAVLTDPLGASAVAELPAVVVGDARAALPIAAAEIYGHPSRRVRVAGITGTSGKTTTSFLIRAGLAAADRPSALLGTVGTFLGGEQVPSALTTPEAAQLQALIAVAAERGIDDVVMEVSSHALSLHRVDEIGFAVAAFTNLSQDHLDFHGSMEDYFAAKARLFDGRAQRAVVCVDDSWGARLADQLGPSAVTVRTTPGPADWSVAAEPITEADGSTSFVVVGPHGSFPAGSIIPGRYNAANALLALAVLAEMGVDPVRVAPAVRAAQVPGRMERVDAGQDFLAVVDYSHKPAAVAGALQALRAVTAGRLIVVLGCGGDRDRGKRPLMGDVAARQADRLIVTDDNPRSEDPAAIRAAMLAGARAVAAAERGEIDEIGDRATAIREAVAAAGAGDTVLIAGKGHETGQEIAGRVLAFDDRSQLRAALTDRMAPA